MVNSVLSYVTAAVGVLSIVWLVWAVGRPPRRRHAEDAARAYFDEHGHWPDDEAAAPLDRPEDAPRPRN